INDEFLDLGLQSMPVGASGQSVGTVNANSGMLTAKGIFVGGVSSAQRGTGILNVAGATVTANVQAGLTSSGQVRVWDTLNSAINFSSGTLRCDTLITSGNPSRFNWTGGTLNITGTGGLAISASGPLGASAT